MVSQYVLDLCQSQETVTNELAKHPDKAVYKIASGLWKKGLTDEVKKPLVNKNKDDKNDTDEFADVLQCGKWGDQRPSDLFLKVRLTS